MDPLERIVRRMAGLEKETLKKEEPEVLIGFIEVLEDETHWVNEKGRLFFPSANELVEMGEALMEAYLAPSWGEER